MRVCVRVCVYIYMYIYICIYIYMYVYIYIYIYVYIYIYIYRERERDCLPLRLPTPSPPFGISSFSFPFGGATNAGVHLGLTPPLRYLFWHRLATTAASQTTGRPRNTSIKIKVARRHYPPPTGISLVPSFTLSPSVSLSFPFRSATTAVSRTTGRPARRPFASGGRLCS